MIQWRKIISYNFHHIPKLSIGFEKLHFYVLFYNVPKYLSTLHWYRHRGLYMYILLEGGGGVQPCDCVIYTKQYMHVHAPRSMAMSMLNCKLDFHMPWAIKQHVASRLLSQYCFQHKNCSLFFSWLQIYKKNVFLVFKKYEINSQGITSQLGKQICNASFPKANNTVPHRH